MVRSCFQPTYEGLKQAYADAINQGASGFQPTYEGLKRYHKVNHAISPGGFQPTYEGLKPTSSACPLSLRSAFSAYLRGIETLISIFLKTLAIRFQPTYEGLKRWYRLA